MYPMSCVNTQNGSIRMILKIFLKSTQVFNEAYAPNTTFASLPYSFSDFVDFSTVKENSFASSAFFNLDAFNVADDHNVRTFRALYVGLT
jgi:hypothetical protein